MRLAFSTAIHVDPDILVVDEALAVGDAVFANRCVRKFQELKERKVTVLFVSHDLGLRRKRAAAKPALESSDSFLGWGDMSQAERGPRRRLLIATSGSCSKGKGAMWRPAHAPN